LDKKLATQTKETHDIEKAIDKLQEAISMAEMDEMQFGTMVDTGPHDKKEKTERTKKTLSKNTHHRGKGDPLKDIPRGIFPGTKHQ